MPFIKYEVSEEEKQILDSAANLDHMKATGWARVIALRTARQTLINEANRKAMDLVSPADMMEFKTVMEQFTEMMAQMSQISEEGA